MNKKEIERIIETEWYSWKRTKEGLLLESYTIEDISQIHLIVSDIGKRIITKTEEAFIKQHPYERRHHDRLMQDIKRRVLEEELQDFTTRLIKLMEDNKSFDGLVLIDIIKKEINRLLEEAKG